MRQHAKIEKRQEVEVGEREERVQIRDRKLVVRGAERASVQDDGSVFGVTDFIAGVNKTHNQNSA